VFLDSLSRANIVAKRFVFAPQQWRFSQLDDVMTRATERREAPHTSTRTRTVEAVERAGWLVGQPVPTPACPAPQRRAGAALAREMPPVEPVERAGWLVGQPVPTPARRHNGGRGRHWPARCCQLCALRRITLRHTSAGCTRGLARTSAGQAARSPGGPPSRGRKPLLCQALRAVSGWHRTRSRLIARRANTARRAGRRVVQAGWLRSCLLPSEWRAARSHTRACSQASGLRSTNAAARRGRGRRARRVIMHVGLPDAERVQDAEHAQDAAGPTGAALAVIAVVATAAPAVVAPTRDCARRLERDGCRGPCGRGGAAVKRGGALTAGPNPGSLHHCLLSLHSTLARLLSLCLFASLPRCLFPSFPLLSIFPSFSLFLSFSLSSGSCLSLSFSLFLFLSLSLSFSLSLSL
jgi:hypothetical protein